MRNIKISKCHFQRHYRCQMKTFMVRVFHKLIYTLFLSTNRRGTSLLLFMYHIIYWSYIINRGEIIECICRSSKRTLRGEVASCFFTNINYISYILILFTTTPTSLQATSKQVCSQSCVNQIIRSERYNRVIVWECCSEGAQHPSPCFFLLFLLRHRLLCGSWKIIYIVVGKRIEKEKHSIVQLAFHRHDVNLDLFWQSFINRQDMYEGVCVCVCVCVCICMYAYFRW